MRNLKIYPKTFFYTLGLLLFIVFVAHALMYILTPQVPLNLSANADHKDALFIGTMNLSPHIKQMIIKVLPISLGCCVLISVLCSLLFSKQITVPVKQISAATEKMAQLDKTAACQLHTKDEIGMLAENINCLYENLLSTIEKLEIEKQRVREMEQSKVDFMRAASHELKTPLTALNAILENMILGVGKYRNVDEYLPECKEMTERLSEMIRDILESSRLDSKKCEDAIETDLAALVLMVCQPYEQIAIARGIQFKMDLSESFCFNIPPQMFKKAISNILANAVAYTAANNVISIYFKESDLVIENECEPIPAPILQHVFEPFYRADYSCDGGNGLGLYIVDTLLKTMELSYTFQPMKHSLGMQFVIHFQ